MPFNKLDMSGKFSFLKLLVDNRTTIVDEYYRHGDREVLRHFAINNWDLMTLHYAEVGITNEGEYFPTIIKFINNLPDNIKVSFLGISIIRKGTTAFHTEHWTKVNGYYRIHVPLLNIDGASIDVIESDGVTCNYTYELGNVYHYENPYDAHKPSNSHQDDRLMILLDFVDTNENPDLSVEELYSKYASAHQEILGLPPS